MNQLAHNTRASSYKRVAVASLAVLSVLGIAVGSIYFADQGSKTGLALSLVLVATPIAAFLALVRPAIFPLAMYIFLVPFDDLLNISAFGTVTKLMAVLSGGLLILWIIRNKKYTAPPKVALTWAVLIAWMTLTLFWAPDMDMATGHLFTFLELFLLYFAMSIFPIDQLDYKVLLLAVVAGGTVAGLYGASLFHSGVDLHRQRLVIATDEGKLNPNHFAASLMLPAALVAIAAFRSRNLLTKFFLLGLMVLLISGVYFAASRAGFFALAAMFAYFWLKKRYRFQVFVCAALAGIAGLMESTSLWTRFATDTHGGSGRVDIWRVGLHAFEHHWLFGVGIGNFPIAFNQAFISVYQPFFTQWQRAAHDLFLQSGVELGILGLALVLAGWFGQFKLLSDINPGDPVYDWRIAIEGATVALFVSAIFADVMYEKYAWLVFGLLVATRSLVLSRQPRQALAPPEGAFRPPWLLTRRSPPLGSSIHSPLGAP